ncbi:MAG: hypothetical protein HC769_30495 [Cyanobacteria bacterium CRU_2_1]|nr:hypothetical protein [Cyanobacteria bacterium RU_5_0]NJR62741.1 hypothetical protein [Cyanobacteria bacterium CRU_2_1]
MSPELNTPETSAPETSAIVEVNQTDAIVEAEMPGETDEVKRETKALIEAIRKRAQDEAHSAEDLAKSAGDFTREAYLKLIRQAREAIEQNKLFDKDQIEKSAQQLQGEAEKNWQALVNEVTELSDRFSEAAKAAWEKLVPPSDKPPGE